MDDRLRNAIIALAPNRARLLIYVDKVLARDNGAVVLLAHLWAPWAEGID